MKAHGGTDGGRSQTRVRSPSKGGGDVTKEDPGGAGATLSQGHTEGLEMWDQGGDGERNQKEESSRARGVEGRGTADDSEVRGEARAMVNLEG